MMNPWDRERTYKQQNGSHDSSPSGGGGILWLIAIIIAVIGLAVMAKHGANKVVVVPIGISLFFMVMFIVSHRREARRLSWRREMSRLQEAAREQQIHASVQVPAPKKPVVDTAMRKIFDRFDTKVIAHGRMYNWNPNEIATFLDFARDFVDTQHAQELISSNEKGELDRHLEAAMDRALLQHDIANPGKKPEGRYKYDDGPPF